ncbi:MAG TPA: Gfo/Idh/MocA family oxidoreductase [Acholeplasma sp.]|nr:Gfo/Idh/MocA family oxidoreductase [Acholeplasma sp.]
MITVSILGFGQRGRVFADAIKKYSNEVSLVAACEINQEKYHMIENEYGISKDKLFHNEEAFFSQGKISDVLVISTMDRAHYEQTIRALNLGYDILLEKPISPNKDEIIKIRDLANKLGRKVAVAHVLRYTKFYQTIKSIIDDGKIGDIVNIHQTENVGYLHYAHSYVRGNWRNSETSSPMILAKSCHDVDILLFLKGKRIKRVSSFGSLYYFKKENKPTNPMDEKIYDPIKFYKENPSWMKVFTENTDVHEVFKNNELSYGKSVFEMDNNVVDNQSLLIQFEDGTSATFIMTAFSKKTHRRIEIKGTKGEILGDLDSNIIEVLPFGDEDYKIDISTLTDDLSHHSGGDNQLLIEFIRAIKNDTDFLTNINYSIESHFVALDAEESRLKDGQVIESQANWDLYDGK